MTRHSYSNSIIFKNSNIVLKKSRVKYYHVVSKIFFHWTILLPRSSVFTFNIDRPLRKITGSVRGIRNLGSWWGNMDSTIIGVSNEVTIRLLIMLNFEVSKWRFWIKLKESNIGHSGRVDISNTRRKLILSTELSEHKTCTYL